MDYYEFLKNKGFKMPKTGMTNVPSLGSHLFPHQIDTTQFLLEAGRGAAFLDTGLGKTAVELEWSQKVLEHTNKPVLFLHR